MRDFDDDQDIFYGDGPDELDDTPVGGKWDRDDQPKTGSGSSFGRRLLYKWLFVGAFGLVGLMIEGGVRLYKWLQQPANAVEHAGDEFQKAGLPAPILILPATQDRDELRFDGQP